MSLTSHTRAGSIPMMQRNLPLWFASVILAGSAACSASVPAASSPPVPASSSNGPAPSAASASGVPSAATPSPPPTLVLPQGVPSVYAEDVAAGDVPLHALIPKGATVEGSWYTTTPAGEAILVAYARPGQDPFRAPRGFIAWRRFAEGPPWRASYGIEHGADEGIVSTQALIADLTGDGSPDALVNEITGGSGACGTWRVVDLSGGTELWTRSLCDAQVAPSADPVGIEITESVFEPGDAHCCPSATRTTVLTYADDGRWSVASRDVTRSGAEPDSD